MTGIETRIRELLDRNVILTKKLKDEILNLSPENQAEFLPLLEDMDSCQTRVFKKATQKNPHFFEELEIMASIEALRRKFGTQSLPKNKTDVDPTTPQRIKLDPYKIVLNAYKRFNGIARDAEISASEREAFFALFKAWVCSLSSEHHAYRLVERQLTDYQHLGILNSDGSWNFRNLRRAARFVLQHQAEEPNFRQLKCYLASDEN